LNLRKKVIRGKHAGVTARMNKSGTYLLISEVDYAQIVLDILTEAA